MPVISIIYIFMIKRKNAAGPRLQDAGPERRGALGVGWLAAACCGQETPGAAPSLACGLVWTEERRGQPPGGPRGELGPGPSPFLLLEPRWGTDQGDVFTRPRGDREWILAPLEDPDAWVPSS